MISLVSSPVLNPHQDSLLHVIQNDSHSYNLKFVNIHRLDLFQDSGRVKIDLPFLNCENIILKSSYIDYQNDTNYFWSGMIKSDTDMFCTTSFFHLTKANGIFCGHLLLGDSFYHIQDLTGGLQVMASETFQADSNWCGTVSGAANVQSRGATEDCIIRKTKLLMWYTEAAQRKVTNIATEIQHMVDLTNCVLSNSLIQEKIELVATLKYHHFIETTKTSIELDFSTFFSDATTIQPTRSLFHADLCGLVTRDYTDILGMSTAKGANLYTAAAGFFISGVKGGAGKIMTVPHEIGHCYHGLHKFESGPQAAVCAHAFDFFKWPFHREGNPYKTAIHEGANIGTAIPFYSNLNVTFKGVTIAQSDENNYCYMNDYKEWVRSYYTEPTAYWAELKETGFVTCNHTRTYEAMPHCGTPSYTYSWWKSIDGIHWTYFSAAKTVNITIPAPPKGECESELYLKCFVRDNNGSGTSLTLDGIAHCYCNCIQK